MWKEKKEKNKNKNKIQTYGSLLKMETNLVDYTNLMIGVTL